ncbi:diaminopimelate epimerase [Lactobacillus sp. LL6]|uniref:diaminopimelate epimerase n=1 Tax=Lactobacillus sp. LL6 TaxID=2596827 RepID=UPI00118603D2|nr:diaminopimelate epimerase [Lactobacillus sp. LL6]TSO26206.1 diaminopimelate epimerase [Lactobacillus sp. LL6]
MKLIKVHGSQNSFFILDETQLSAPLGDDLLKTFTQKITSPNNPLGGADGVLVITEATTSKAIAKMRVINSDGSEASMCGNGLRTVARYLSEKFSQDSFAVETMNANLRVRREKNLAKGIYTFAVEISPVSFNKASLPFDNLGHERIIDTFLPEIYPGLKFTSIAVPNPHLISFISQEQIESDILKDVGSYLNSPNPYYPDGVNVNFAQILDKNQLFVRTFERGVGFTNACGTGMSATSLAFCLTHPEWAKFETPINVYNPGGMVKVIVHHDSTYWMELIGNATFTKIINLPEKSLYDFNFSHAQVINTNEQQDYENFVASLPTFNNLRAK